MIDTTSVGRSSSAGASASELSSDASARVGVGARLVALVARLAASMSGVGSQEHACSAPSTSRARRSRRCTILNVRAQSVTRALDSRALDLLQSGEAGTDGIASGNMGRRLQMDEPYLMSEAIDQLVEEFGGEDAILASIPYE